MSSRSQLRRPVALRFIAWAYIVLGVALVMAAGLGPADEESRDLPLWLPAMSFFSGVFVMAAGAALVNDRRWSRAFSVNVAIGLLALLGISFVIQAIGGSPVAMVPLFASALPMFFIFYLTRRYVRDYFSRLR